jgi:hypothetical protein
MYTTYGYGYALILTKNYWATLWAIFSQAHLVTLIKSVLNLTKGLSCYKNIAKFFHRIAKCQTSQNHHSNCRDQNVGIINLP